ncbi:RNA polymerase sigma factor [Solimonas sp. SE-A11]|uniref:RNA polymerase sigma factor n=1 Tax=Solimonas sp. SE-A11 TaxID=3054954 RepID=UPI00259C7F2A|nr:sigma-70 family RNA polymerase sigma factor [Solimonas sp. SE-A11]MDM4773039.1 sigma-70 family RNA polymerase sigma factor [Solimonas sp. SE-A11]
MNPNQAEAHRHPQIVTAAWIADLKASGERRREAMARLYRAYAPRLAAYYRAQGADRVAADDWVHDTFLRVMRGVGSLETDAAFAGWMWAIARNVMIDARRRKNSRLASLDQIDESGLALWETVVCDKAGPDEALEQWQHTALVGQQFAAFRRDFPERARCIAWSCREDMSMGELATVIGRSVGATREYLSQSRKKARVYLQPCLEAA